MSAIYVQEGRNIRCPALGFELPLPPDWAVMGSGVSMGSAHFTIARGGAHPQFVLKASPEDHPRLSKYLQEEIRLKAYPKRLVYPFGEVFNGPVHDPILFLKNRIIFNLDLGGRAPEIWEAAHFALRRLTFFTPKVERLHPALKDFRYLHPGVPLGKVATPPGFAAAELHARLRALETARDRNAPGTPRLERYERRALLARAWMPFNYGHVFAALGDMPKARAAFAEHAKLWDGILAQAADEHQGYIDALHSALLCGDGLLARRLAGRRGELQGDTKAVPDRAAYERALPALVLGKDDEALASLARAKAVSPENAWRRGLGELARAVVERDAAALAPSLEELLSHHHGRANHRGSDLWNSELSYLCVPAIALLVVARERGLSVPEPPSKRATLKNLLAVYLTEFQGRPLEKGTTYDLDVDYVPDALLRGGFEIPSS